MHHMPLAYYTIIQADDDLLPGALHGLEHMTQSTHPAVMRDMDRQGQARAPEDPVCSRPDNHPTSDSSPVLHHPQAMPLRLARPETPRRATAPDAQKPAPDPAYARPRNKSPYSRSSTSSRSKNLPSASQPAILRTQSLPTPSTSPSSLSPMVGSTSPLLRSPPVSGSPFRPASPYDYSLPSYDGGFETISEHAELDLSRSSLDSSRPINALNSSRPVGPPRRPRTASPSRSPLMSSASSPSLPTYRFNEGLPSPSLHHYSSTSSFSSMPSTPSTTRSRSPSISSLETIEDVPDAEWQAIEADRLAKLAKADEDEDDGVVRRSGSLDITPRGFGFGRQNAKKRWSVCGAERRADLDLETIWED